METRVENLEERLGAMDSRLNNVGERLETLQQGNLALGRDFSAMRDLVMDALDEIKSIRRAEDKGKAPMNSSETPSVAISRGDEVGGVDTGNRGEMRGISKQPEKEPGRFRRLKLSLFSGEDPVSK